jgi:hypothetical protein
MDQPAFSLPKKIVGWRNEGSNIALRSFSLYEPKGTFKGGREEEQRRS